MQTGSRNRVIFPPLKWHQGKARLLPMILIALVAVGSGIWFATQRTTPEQKEEQRLVSIQSTLKNAIILPEDFKSVPDFNLVDKDGQPADQSVLEDRWTLLFFGFTQCPDVCPTTLSTLRTAVQTIAVDHAELPQPEVAFISIDPNRDKPTDLKRYIEFFNPAFQAFTTDDINAMYALINPLNIVVVYTADEQNPEHYTVDHTASIFLVDPQRRLRGRFSAPHQAPELAQDYATLMAALQP